MRKVFTLILAIMASATIAWAENPSGTCGTNLTWEYDPATTTMTISGSGAMDDYNSFMDVPWVSFRSNITSIVLSEGLTYIGKQAFMVCSNITSITIPSSVETIGGCAFQACYDLSSVTFVAGSQLTTINESAFLDCGLISVTLPENMTSIGDQAFGRCEELTSILIPNKVNTIGVAAFLKCEALTSVTIPSSVTNLGMGAFAMCPSLEDIYVGWESPLTTGLGNDVFLNIASPATLHVPYGKKTLYEATAPWSSFTIVEMNPSGTCGENLTWEYDPATHTLTIQGSGAMTNFEDDSDLSGVVSSYIPWSSYSNAIQSISLPDGLTTIGDLAFSYCVSLQTIHIPAGVTRIGNEAFSGCTALTTINIPDGVTSIEQEAFYMCTYLRAIDIPASVTSIGGSAFGCSGLINVHVHWATPPANVYPNAFNGIHKFAYLLVPAGSENNYTNAPWSNFGFIDVFGECGEHLTWEYNPATTTLAISGTGAMTDYANSSANKAPWDSYKESIESIILPDGLTRIGNHAFYGCDNAALTSVTIPNSVTNIGEYAFSNFHSLTSIEIPASVTSLESNAFSFSKNLQTVTFAAGSHLETIGEKAFSSCTGLTSAEIPAGVTSIGEYAFQNCSTLVSVTIPETVTSIRTNAFAGCSGLTSITVDPNNAVYDSRENCNAIIETSSNKLLRGCNNNTVVIPSTVTAIGDYAFSGCSGLTSTTIPAGVTIIGDRAFTGCTGLGSINFPDGLTSIGEYAFSGCSGLGGSITIPESVTSIGKRAFQNCSTLVSITSLGSITEISEYTFYNCSGLSSATIPASVTSIGIRAFNGCSGLTDIYVYWPSNLPTPNANAFTNYTATLHVPDGTKDVYLAVEPWKNFNIVEETATGVEPITNDPYGASRSEESPITNKIIKDGQLLIERNGVLYNAAGQEVR